MLTHMFNRITLAAALATSIGIGARAAERATFVLADGSRQSGEVVFHGTGNRNIIDNYLNLGEGGKERTFPVDQVVLIDFGGGEPVAADFQPVSAAGDQILVMRNGQAQRGKLVNLVNGDTVQWQADNGQTQPFAIRDVARIYLNPQAARRIYAQLANAAPAATATSGTIDRTDNQPVPRGAVRVNANTPWTPSGLRVLKGQRVAFSTTGEVQFNTDASHHVGPDGEGSMKSPNYPVPAMPVGGLIAKVGDSAPFPIGSNREPIIMPASGELMLGINDDQFGDNSGSFIVTLTRR